jgi:RNA polymerase sigma-70 factor (ECF subfamily)
MRAGDAARASHADADIAGCLRAFETEFDFVRRALRWQGVRPGDADDLAQEVFLVLWRRWRELDRSRPLRPWLSGVVLKVAQQHRRREGRFVPGGLIDHEDPHRSTEDQLHSARARALVLRALGELSDRQRQVVVMHDLEGLPMREIASGLGVPLFTAYTRLRSGRRSLAAAIEALESGTRPRSRLGMLVAWWTRPSMHAVAVAAVGLTIALGLASWPSGAERSAGSDPARSLAQGLIGYWSFDDAPEQTGGVMSDRSGGGNDCLLRSTGPAPGGHGVSGVVGGGLALDGNSWLECPRLERLARVRTELSMALWIRTASGADGSRQALVTRQLETSGDRLFSLRMQGGQLEFLSHVWKTLMRRPYPGGGGWNHLAAVRDATGSRLYVNGVLVGRNVRTSPGSVGGGGGALIVGGQVNGPEPGDARDRFRGDLDELLVYDRALREPEIAALATRVRPRGAW